MNTISTKGIADHEIAVFKQYLNFKPELGDGISSSLFWKLFYKKYKHFVWFYENKLYKISSDPYRMYEVNTEVHTVFQDKGATDKQTEIITITLVLFILFGLSKVPLDLSLFSRDEVTLITFGLLFLLFLSFKVPKLFYRFRFKILRK